MHYLRGKLLEKRQLLLGLIQAELAGTDEPAGLPNDPVDIASSISARETSYAVGSVESDTIAQIDYILRKLDNGKYGICEDCGKRISPARLRVIPFASLCVMCKASEEKEAPRLTGEDRAEMKDLASVLDIRDGEEEAVREMLRVSRLA
jgi:DnaK suppressor protein